MLSTFFLPYGPMSMKINKHSRKSLNFDLFSRAYRREQPIKVERNAWKIGSEIIAIQTTDYNSISRALTADIDFC